jgi:hypothetical protein
MDRRTIGQTGRQTETKSSDRSVGEQVRRYLVYPVTYCINSIRSYNASTLDQKLLKC